MGLAEDHSKYLREYLWNGTKPSRREYEKSKRHGIPAGFNPGASMNWWVLGVGVRQAFGDLSENEAAADRLHKERHEYGTWGSEQHSPIYWPFHLQGRIVMIKDSGHDTLKALASSQIADFFVHCHLCRTPDDKQIMFCGMRGTGMKQWSSHELWWMFHTHIMGKEGLPKKKYWTRGNSELTYGWMWSPVTSRILSDIRPQVMNKLDTLSVDGIRSPTHYLTFSDGDKWVYTEDDQHSSTLFRGGSGILQGREVSAPWNWKVHKRAQGASSEVHTDLSNGRLRITYSGPYNEFAGAKPIVWDAPRASVESHLIWDRQGLRRA